MLADTTKAAPTQVLDPRRSVREMYARQFGPRENERLLGRSRFFLKHATFGITFIGETHSARHT